MSLYSLQGAPAKTYYQVIHKQCSKDVRGNTLGQLINLQSQTCHSEDTTSWNTFLWVEFIRDYGPNSDSDSAVPEIVRPKNRLSASEANPVTVSNGAVLPGCFIGLSRVKEETDCPLPLCKGIPEISILWCTNIPISRNCGNVATLASKMVQSTVIGE